MVVQPPVLLKVCYLSVTVNNNDFRNTALLIATI